MIVTLLDKLLQRWEKRLQRRRREKELKIQDEQMRLF